MRLTIGELLASSARKFPRKEAIVFQDFRLDYQALDHRANRAANMLRARGMEKGDRCAILFYNRGEWAELYFGLAKAGIVAVPASADSERRPISPRPKTDPQSQATT